LIRLRSEFCAENLNQLDTDFRETTWKTDSDFLHENLKSKFLLPECGEPSCKISGLRAKGRSLSQGGVTLKEPTLSEQNCSFVKLTPLTTAAAKRLRDSILRQARCQ
jgi:hypothetical protein